MSEREREILLFCSHPQSINDEKALSELNRLISDGQRLSGGLAFEFDALVGHVTIKAIKPPATKP